MRTAVIYNFLIEATIIAGIAILLMIPVRKFFRKELGSRVICLAWLMVAIRLLCPLSLPNPLINEIVTPYNDQPEAIRPIAGQVRVRVSDALSDLSQQTIKRHMNEEGLTYRQAFEKPDYQLLSNMSNDIYSHGRIAKGIMLVYAAGVLGVAGWFTAANIRFRKKLNRNRIAPLEGELLAYYNGLCEQYKVKPLPVYRVDPLSSACLVGAVKPFIALPLAAEVGQAKHMLAHEICHYKAKDHIWTLVTLICCIVHWFNPLVWAAASMSRMDRELRCDDNVTKNMDEDQRKLYAGTLIQSVTRRTIPGLPVLCTGMSMTGRKLKARVGGILWGGRYKKALAAVCIGALCLLVVASFGTSAYGEVPEPWSYWNSADEELVYDIQEWEEALAAENAIKTDEEAIQAAKDILTGPYYKVDLDSWNLKWVVERGSGWMGKATYFIYGKKNNINYVYVFLAADGSGAHMTTVSGDPFIKDDYFEKYGIHEANPANEYAEPLSDVLTEEEQQKIMDYCLALAEELEPGRSSDFREIHFNCYVQAGDELYVQLEAPYNVNSGVIFNLLVKPELRMIDYNTGNG